VLEFKYNHYEYIKYSHMIVIGFCC